MNDVTIVNELKRLSRRIEGIVKTIDLIYSDRDILEDILTRLTAVEHALHLQRSTATETAKDMKKEINGIQDVVEDKVEEVNKTIDSKVVEVKKEKKGLFKKLFRR